MAASFLMLKGSLDAEIIYVDIEPDIVINTEEDVYLDLDMNGSMDFLFSKHSGFAPVFGGYYGYYTYSSVTWSVKSFRAKGMLSNKMVALSETSTSKGTKYFFYGVDPLDSDSLINNYDNFVGDGYMFHMAGKKRMLSATSHIPVGDWYYFWSVNSWNYNELLGADRYAGVQFQTGEDCSVYGWIRCAVVDSNETLIIKDYAYETFCNWGIYTGDTSGGPIASIQTDLPTVRMFENNGSIYIELSQIPAHNSLNIADVNGRKIHSSTIQNLQTIIEVPTPGVYVVSLNIDGRIFNKKVVVMN